MRSAPDGLARGARRARWPEGLALEVERCVGGARARAGARADGSKSSSAAPARAAHRARARPRPRPPGSGSVARLRSSSRAAWPSVRAGRPAAPPRECDAITASRSLEVIGGTVGGRSPGRTRRASSAASQTLIASLARRRRAARSGCRRAARVEPLVRERRENAAAFARSCSTRRGRSSELERRECAGDGRRRRRGREDERARGDDEIAGERTPRRRPTYAP